MNRRPIRRKMGLNFKDKNIGSGAIKIKLKFGILGI